MKKEHLPEEVASEAKSDGIRVRFYWKIRENKGFMVERKWMAAYKRIVSAIADDDLRAIAETAKPLAWINGKINRIGALGVNFVLADTALPVMTFGLAVLTKPALALEAFEKASGMAFQSYDRAVRGMQIAGGLTAAFGLGEAIGAANRLPYRLSGFAADMTGATGEFVVKNVVNRIVHKPIAPQPMPA